MSKTTHDPDQPLRRIMADLGEPFGQTFIVECRGDEEDDVQFEPMLQTADADAPLVELLPAAIRGAGLLYGLEDLAIVEASYAAGVVHEEDESGEPSELRAARFVLYPPEDDLSYVVIIAAEGDDEPKLMMWVWTVNSADGQAEPTEGAATP